MKKVTLLLLLFSGLLGTAHAQKGEKSIAAGPLISFPLGLESMGTVFKIGPGVEFIGQ